MALLQPQETEQLTHYPVTDRLMLDKLDSARRSRSTNVDERKTQQKFRKTDVREIKLVNVPAAAEEKVDKVYGDAQEFIKNFDSSIIKCKRFNEVKTYRKYEVIMRDMELEIVKLKDKLQMEEQMRTPTKEYLSDILNKLVEYKTDNQRLQRELIERDKLIANQQHELQNLKSAMQRLQNTLRGRIDRLPPLQSTRSKSDSLEEPVKTFLQQKTRTNSDFNLKSSKLEEFLKITWQHIWEWDVTRLLSELDKFIEKVPEQLQVDMWKIRLGAAKRLSSVMDTSPNKSMSSLTNMTLTEVETQRTDNSKQKVAHWSLLKRSRRR